MYSRQGQGPARFPAGCGVFVFARRREASIVCLIDKMSINPTYAYNEISESRSTMAQPQFVSETKIMRRVASDPRCAFRFLPHAQKQMAMRDIVAADVLNVLTKGLVTLIEYKQDVLWRALGRDIDGRELEVIAAVDEAEIKIKVVTAF